MSKGLLEPSDEKQTRVTWPENKQLWQLLLSQDSSLQKHYRPVFTWLCVYSFRFTMAELYPMMEAVTLRAESYTYWVSHVSDILEAKQDKKSGK